MKEYKKMLKNMFKFEGRARRREYWVVTVINSAISNFLNAMMFFASTLAGETLCYRAGLAAGFSTTGAKIGTIMAVPVAVFAIYTVVSVLALTVRRYHDAGFPGWAFPICLLGCCAFGIGGIVHLVFCFMPSVEDNAYGENPKTPENNEYEDSRGIVGAIILLLVGMVLLIASVGFNIVKCGLREVPDNVYVDFITEEEITAEDDTALEQQDTEADTEMDIEESTDAITQENEAVGDEESYTITIGSLELILTPPAEAEDIYSGDFMVTYNYENIYVEYSDSFCEVEEDCLSQLRDKYDMQAEDNDLDILGCVEPTETKVGTYDAFYYKLVNTDGEDFNYSYYTFFVDIGAENYLEVIVHGMSEDFTEDDAFEIANLRL